MDELMDRYAMIYELEKRMGIQDSDYEADGLYELSDKELKQMLELN